MIQYSIDHRTPNTQAASASVAVVAMSQESMF